MTETPPSGAVERLFERAALVSARLALPLVVAALALTGLFGWYAATNLGMNTDPTDLLARDLPFRALSRAHDKAFPHDQDNLVVVLDGRNVDLVEDGAQRLAARLAARPKMFRQVFYPQGEPYFRKNGLLYLSEKELARLAERLAQSQPLIGALSEDPTVRGLFGVLDLAMRAAAEGKAGTTTGGLDRAMERIAAVMNARSAGKPASLSWIELMRGGEVGPSDRRRIIIVQPRLDFGSLQPGKAAMRAVRAAALEVGLTPEHGVRVRLTGPVALDTEELTSVQTGASLAGLVSLVLVSIMLFWGLKTWRLVLAVLTTLIVGLVWTGAFAALAIGELNMISVAFAVLFIGLAVDFGIHYALRYHEAVGHGDAAPLGRAGRSVGGSLALSAGTSAAAFLSFYPTDYRGISELGVIAAAGVAIALLLNLTLLPALLALLPVRSRRGPRTSRVASRADAYIRRHARSICLGALVLGLAAIPVAAMMRFDHNPLNLKDPNTESVQTVKALLDDPSAAPFTASVLAPDLTTARALAKRFERLPTVDKAITIGDFVPTNQPPKLEIIEQMGLLLTATLENPIRKPAPDYPAAQAAFETLLGRLKSLDAAGNAGDLAPRVKAMIAAMERFKARTGLSFAALADLDRVLVGTFPGRMEALRASMAAGRVTLADLPKALRDRRIAADGRVRVEVFPKADLTDGRALKAFVGEIRAVSPKVTDAPVSILEGGRVVVASFYQATGLALVVILVLLTALLRRATDVLLVMGPLLLAAVATVALARLVGLSFNLANVIVLPLLLGLAVDFGIHLTRRARATGGAQLLHTSTPRAVLFSALTTVASFGSLALSGHRGSASMGLLLMIAIAMSIACSLILLPAMIAWREGRRSAKADRKAKAHGR